MCKKVPGSIALFVFRSRELSVPVEGEVTGLVNHLILVIRRSTVPFLPTWREQTLHQLDLDCLLMNSENELGKIEMRWRSVPVQIHSSLFLSALAEFHTKLEDSRKSSPPPLKSSMKPY